MTAWLVVTLMAPLASFGEQAGNVERASADRPTRSALIGLAGAALGLRRDDRDGQRRLAASLRIATASFGLGTLVRDFHTYQSLPVASKPPPRTRVEALARRCDLNTSLTRREYRADVWHEAAYAVRPGAGLALATLRDAFRKPRFVLFLGRKACPLGAPLDPAIIEAGDVRQAFARRRAASAWSERRSGLDPRNWRHGDAVVAVEQRDDLGPTAQPVNRRRRHDDPGDRLTWQFAAREEFVLGAIADDSRAIEEGGQ